MRPWQQSCQDPEGTAYINFIQNMIKSIVRIQREFNIPMCDVFPQTFDDIVQLHDDLCKYSQCNNTLREWTSSRFYGKYSRG